MRLVRLKIKPNVRKVLSTIASQFRTGESDFVEDMYALLRRKGAGLPSPKRIELIKKALISKGKLTPVNAGIMVSKRLQVLKDAAKTAYFKGLASQKDPIDAVRRLLLNFQRMYLKYREVQCATCGFKTDCDFGKQYSHMTQDIRKVYDVDFSQKVHPQCPVLPELEAIGQFKSAIETFRSMNQQKPEQALSKEEMRSEEELAAAAEAANAQTDDTNNVLDPESDGDVMMFDNPEYDAKDFKGTNAGPGGHTGQLYVNYFEKFVAEISKEKMLIFELGTQFSKLLGIEKKGKMKPDTNPAADRRPEKMTKMSDESKLISSEHGKPKELFEQQLSRKQLQKKQDMTPEKRKRLRYLLIDDSGSMRTVLDRNQYGMLNRAALSCVFAMALVRQARDESGMVIVRFFGGDCGPIIVARNKAEFDDLLLMIANADFNSGSTDILKAFRTAIADIKAARDEISKSEITMLTDALDSFDGKAAKKSLGDQEVNILDVSARASGAAQYKARTALRSVAKRYFQVDPAKLSLKDIVSVI